MGVQGTINLTPQQLPAFLQKLGMAATQIDTASFFKQVGIALENSAKDCFNNSKSPWNQPWSPLKHPRPLGGNKPLLDRGLLRGSLTNNGNGHIDRVSGNTLEWGTNLESALIHNFGCVITPKKAKFLAIPASVEAQRAGSPRNFPNAKRRFRWALKKDGTGGFIYEVIGKAKKGGRGAGVGGRSSKRGSKFARSVSKGLKRLKRFGKKLSRMAKKGMRALRRSYMKIKRLTKKIMQLQKKLQSAGLSFKAAEVIGNALTRAKKQLKQAKAQHLQLKRGKNAKIEKGKQNKVMIGNKLVHYFLTKRVYIPARTFIGINEPIEGVILAILMDHIERGLQNKVGS